MKKKKYSISDGTSSTQSVLRTAEQSAAIGSANRSPYQTIKTSLKSVVRSEIVIEKLTKTALMANRLMIHCLNFIKLYIIYCYDNNLELPFLDRLFVT